MSSMSNINKVFMIGNLGNSPELRYTTKGNPVANFPIATNRSIRDPNGEWKSVTEWHHAVVWGKKAEACSKYLAKGHRVFIEGTIQLNTWKDEEGKHHNKTEIIVHEIRFLNNRLNIENTEELHATESIAISNSA